MRVPSAGGGQCYNACVDLERTVETLARIVTDLVSDHKELRDLVEQTARIQLRMAEEQADQRRSLNGLTQLVAEIATDLKETRVDLRELAEIQKQTDLKLERLAERTDRQFAEVGEKINQLTDNMNALIRVVDDLIRRDGRRE